MRIVKKIMRLKSIFNSKGQTLTETIVAIGILTTGIIGGLSLAIFSLGASDVAIKQVVATNLAREGVEIVRNFRDTNWLTGNLTDCSSDIGAANQDCYEDWASGFPGIPGNVRYRVVFDPSTNTWTLEPAGPPKLRLYLQPNGTYTPSGSDDAPFRRQVDLSLDISAPFSSNNARLIVRSTVWWEQGKRCPAPESDPDNTQCKVIVEETLTNWKNY